MNPGLCIFSSFFSHWQATKLIFEIHQDRKIHLSLIKDIRMEGITIKFSYSNKLYNGKRRRSLEVVLWEQTKRIGKKRWRKNAVYKNALFGFSCIASCLKGRAYILQLPAINFALANLYFIDFFFCQINPLYIVSGFQR